MKKTISIDFDGTICDWAFPGCGPLKPGAKEAIDTLKQDYIIVISSCRTSAMFKDQPDRAQIITAMVDFLSENDIYYDRIDNGEEGKIVAEAYIDDRAIRFTSWDDVMFNFKPTPKRRKDDTP